MKKSLYKEIDGDLIELFKKGEFDVIAHGCNCYATMGAGIALTIGREFPEAMTADKKMKIPNGIKRLGKLTYTEIDSLFKKGKDRPKYLFNLYSQHYPGPDFKMNALRNALREMKNVLNFDCYSLPKEEIRIGLPLIGCGIAGGDWEKVSKLIQKELEGFDVTIIHFKQQVLGVNYFPPRVKEKSNDMADDVKLAKQEQFFTDEEVARYFLDEYGVDINAMTIKELDEFLETI